MRVLKVVSAVFGGLSGGLAVAERVGETALVRREVAPPDAADSEPPPPVRDAYPSQSGSAAALDAYLERAGTATRRA